MTILHDEGESLGEPWRIEPSDKGGEANDELSRRNRRRGWDRSAKTIVRGGRHRKKRDPFGDTGKNTKSEIL